MQQVEALVTFLYNGETSVLKKDIESFLQQVRDFEVRGLAEEEDLHKIVPDSFIEQDHETMNTLDDNNFITE